jgi:hypothetical protein
VSKQDKVVDLGLVAPTVKPEGEKPQQLDLFDALMGSTTADDEAAVELTDEDLGSLGDEYRVVAELTRKKRKLEAEVKQVGAELVAARARMQNAMTLQGTKQFKGTDDDGACSVGTRYVTRVTDVEAFISWVMSTNPSLLTVNAQSRTKFIREEFKDKGVPADADEFPPGIEAEEEPYLSVRGVRDVTTPSNTTKEQKAT